MTGAELPLDGLRVLDYGQYVASPFATMLLSDLGADVIKVEPPSGDEWRRYDPFEDGESRYFYALNRGKRSVALDLKSPEGRERSRALIASADALVHNCLPERARRFGLDSESVRAVNPRCVTVCVSAFGSSGPDSNRPAYDLIGQALSGLLLADPRPGDAVPRRTGGLALADFTAGLLAALAVTAGLLGRGERAPDLEVSLLGAALALQAQRFVEVERSAATPAEAPTSPPRARPAAPSSRRSPVRAARAGGARPLLPRPRLRRRLHRARLPQQRPAPPGLRAARARRPVRRQPAGRAGGRARSTSGAPPTCAPWRTASRVSASARPWRRSPHGACPRARCGASASSSTTPRCARTASCRRSSSRGVGPVRLLGSPFKVDGAAAGARAARRRRSDEHADELFGAPARR